MTNNIWQITEDDNPALADVRIYYPSGKWKTIGTYDQWKSLLHKASTFFDEMQIEHISSIYGALRNAEIEINKALERLENVPENIEAFLVVHSKEPEMIRAWETQKRNMNEVTARYNVILQKVEELQGAGYEVWRWDEWLEDGLPFISVKMKKIL